MDNLTQHTEIMLALGELKGSATATNQHLVQLNSKVATHEGRLNHMDVEDGKLFVYLETLKESQKKESSFKGKWIDRGLMIVFNAIITLGLLLLVRSGIVNLETTPRTPEEIQKRQIELQAEAQKLYLDTVKNTTK